MDVKQYLANQRQGTSKSKERNEVAGSTKKIKKQKGTGGARAGSLKSPVFVGGGTIFGPRPRDYSFKLNKKVKRLAKCSVLSDKASKSSLFVVNSLEMTAPKTKDFVKMLADLSCSDKKSLFIIDRQDNNFILSGRNIPNTKVTTVNELSTYDLLHADRLYIAQNAVEQIEKILA